MKTVNTLKSAEISVNGEVKETVKIENPCQMWKALHGWADKYGQDVRILVSREDGTAYKDFTVKPLKNGRYYLVNAVKETNRWMMMKAAGKTPTKAKKAAAKPVQKTAEEIAAEKAAAKKAKKAAYDKARRARLKAQKAAAEQA